MSSFGLRVSLAGWVDEVNTSRSIGVVTLKRDLRALHSVVSYTSLKSSKASYDFR